MNYASIKEFDIANGPGVRISLFVSGCRHHCKGCFNQETWDFAYGQPFTQEVEEDILRGLKDDNIQGLSLLGGEPMDPDNQPGWLSLAREVKKRYPSKDIWCYTGYLFDKDILGWMKGEIPETRELLQYVDVFVDGPFMEDRKDISLVFRGSGNQRIIDVRKSLAEGKTVLWTNHLGMPYK